MCLIMPPRRTPGVNKTRGFTLLEILISIIVLTIGMLGALGTQLVAKRSNYEALQRTQAAMLANTVIDRMRANPGTAHEVLDCYADTDLGSGVDGSSPCGQGSTGLFALANVDRQDIDSFADELGGQNSGSGALVTPLVCITHNAAPVAGSGNVRVVVAWRGMSARPKDADGNLTTTLADSNCGTAIDLNYRKQVVMDMYIAPTRS